ncbi:DNA polymerase-1 [Mycoplasmoides fastidiosum]|uniref:5'-3' exonuclease n=1 Tax=Mycoplasmoides fastidiosum TaxID=92758 RepID=A0ABU0M034_9BACT|nr:5'-3' exonuclease [Mycoplasmoides fastidiosum]MDQ0514200.1 DNA polymerase-1 [Mycoplasmoides fastidiosum]UUD37390.1 5'-3' exonuclease [Mycoplasmoides fastidiosum]
MNNSNNYRLDTKKAIVIDGLSLIYRAYFATFSQLSYYLKNDLKPANAVRMMIIMMSALLKLKKYDYALVAFDVSRKSFRTEMFEDYKANRKPMEEHLSDQLPVIIEALELMGFQIVSLPGFEADDIIGTFSHLCNQQGISVDVFSSDNDLLQLVNDLTTVNIIKKGVSDIKTYHADNFTDLSDGINPSQIIDVKGLSGDTSDNYRGIEGIGPKTALKLVKTFGSISQMFAQIDQLPPKIAKALTQERDQVELFLKLATILTDVAIPQDLNHYQYRPQSLALVEQFLAKTGLNNLRKYFE